MGSSIPSTSGSVPHQSANEIVHVGIVGCGGMGRGVARHLLPFADVRIIAVADPADSYADDFFYKSTVGRLPVKQEIEKHYADAGCPVQVADYLDYRVMLDQEKDLDAIVCATPDHLHAVVSLTAMRQGKHVYCEKPLAHNIRETRLLAEVARETGVATQMGNIGHARDGMRETCEWIRDGAIGAVREVHAWVGASRWNKHLVAPPEDSPPVPEGLDWDLWLGPRTPIPYHPACFPVKWRDFWQFGLGAIGDFFCHDVDVACWALDLQTPDSVEAFAAGSTHPDLTPHGELVYYTFPERQGRPPLRLTWYDGGLRPPTPTDWPEDEPLPRRGIFFIGDNGILVSPGLGAAPRLLPQVLMATYTPPEPSIPRSPGHHREWIDACKGGPAPMSHFQYSARLSELALLGVLAVRTGRKIHWDAQSMSVPGCPEADPIIQGEYRQGWTLDEALNG